MSLKRWIWLATLLALMMGVPKAWAQTVAVNMPPTASYQPGGQTVLSFAVTKTGSGAVSSNITLDFSGATQLASQSWAVTSVGASVTTTPALPVGTGNVSFTVNFPTASPRSVNIRIELRHKFDASGSYSLTMEADTGGTVTSGTTNFTSSGGPVNTLCSVPGNDGDPGTITTQQVVNTYFPAPADATLRTVSAGSRCLPVTRTGAEGLDPQADANRLNDIQAGDLLLVIQMQGADIDSSDTTDYGDGNTPGGGDTVAGNDGGLTSLRQAGLYEFVVAQGAINTVGAGGASSPNCATTGDGSAANPDLIPISGAGTGANLRGLINSYERQDDAGNGIRRRYQVIRVPQYSAVSFGAGGRLQAFAWNGSVGGVLAVDSQGAVDLGTGANTDVRFDVAGRGFRGGAALDGAGSATAAELFRIAAAGVATHAYKGEGIAGTPDRVWDGTAEQVTTGALYPNGAVGRGAPGNAGGGGNSCGPATNDGVSGGAGGSSHGRGGNGGNCANPDSTYTDITLGGRRPGGLGSSTTRMYMGGGGGAGGKNGGGADESHGGVGGGLVFLRARNIVGNGTIDADGASGSNGNDAVNVAGGGGAGAGGSIALLVDIGGGNSLSNTIFRVRGGKGGDAAMAEPALDTNNTGPGGGGGGGVLLTSHLSNQLTGTIQRLGGAGGTTTDDATSYGENPGDTGSQTSGLNAFDLMPGARPGYTCETTVPVTLSFVESKIEGQQLRVVFETASEAGTLGFRVSQGGPAGSRNGIVSELIAGRGDALGPARYEVVMPYRGAAELWIEEQDVRSQPTVFGPFPIGSPSGEQNIAVSTDWQAIQAEQNAFRAAEAQAILARRSSTGSVVELRTSRRGWYSVSFEQLAALGVDWNGVETRRIELRRGNRAIPIEVGAATWQAGAALRFYGEQVDGSLYTDSAVYRLQLVAGDAETMRPVYANAGNLSTVSTYLHTLVHAPNRAYGFSSPIDPWYAARILRNANNPGTASETVTVTDRVPGSTARMTVDFWGGTSFAQSPDHAVRVLVNGTPVGEARFDGLVAHTMTVDLPANALIDGANTVAFQLLGDTGAPADIVYLERIAIDYVRNLKLEANGSVAFGAAQGSAGATDGDRIFAGDFSNEGTPACSGMTPGCAAYAVQVGASNTARAFRIRDGIAQPLTAAVNGGVLRFAALSRPGDQFRVETAAAAPALRVAEPVGNLFGGLAAVDYLVVSHPSFSAGLQPLLAARQAEGLRTHVVNVEDLYRAYTGGEFGPAAVEAFLRESHQRWPMLRYVLFVGGDTYDYRNHSGLNSIGFVPTHYRATSEFVRYAPTDTVYADVNGDGVKELAIGRFPVRTAAELANVVAKTLAYPTAGHSKRLHWVADRDDSRYSFGRVSASFLTSFDGWSVSATDLAAYPQSAGAAQARGDIVNAINAGRSMFGFYGHSSPSSWSREGLLTATQVNSGLFNNATRPTTLFQLGCWGGYFVEPEYSSLSHALLLQPSGAAAVIAATALTEVVSDEFMAAEALPALSSGQRIGDVVRDAANRIRTSNPEALDVIIGTTVLGDPALRINVQQPR